MHRSYERGMVNVAKGRGNEYDPQMSCPWYIDKKQASEWRVASESLHREGYSKVLRTHELAPYKKLDQQGDNNEENM